MKVRIKACPKADSGLQVEGGQATPISDSMVMLGGKTHEEGGTDIAYNGQQVEAEKGEPVSIGNKGEAIVWGNMTVPGTSKKFKNVAKQLGEQEAKYTKVNDTATSLLAENNPEDKWQRLKFNSGRVMQLGALFAQTSINQKTEQLGNVQRALLETAHDNNLDPQALSKGNIKKAKKGAFLEYADMGFTADGEDPKKNKRSRSDRNNNPGNIKFGKFARSMGATAQDKDGFAIFPDPTAGQSAMYSLLTGKGYKDLPVKDAISKWTAGSPYDLKGLGDLQAKKVSDLKPNELSTVLDYMRQGEGTAYGADKGNFKPPNVTASNPSPYTGIPYTYKEGVLPPQTLSGDPNKPKPQTYHPDPLGDITPIQRPNMPSNVQALKLGQIAPELYGFATNKEVPVALQKYTPQLYVPYQMSFQDQINDNTATGNAQRRIFSGNPALASAVGAQEYEANNRVRANEFRTNQGIQADTINKNIALNNDAQLKNLQLADTQFVRQSEAKSRTKEINQAILNSIAGKYQQNDLSNKRLAAYENLYDYRFNDTNNDAIPDQATYYGPDAQFNFSGGGAAANQSINPYSRTVIQKKDGNTTTRVITPSQQDVQIKNQSLLEKTRKNSPLKRFWQSLGI